LVKEPQAVEFASEDLHATRCFISRPEHTFDIDLRMVALQRSERKCLGDLGIEQTEFFRFPIVNQSPAFGDLNLMHEKVLSRAFGNTFGHPLKETSAAGRADFRNLYQGADEGR
jgi:hypothetical protein